MVRSAWRLSQWLGTTIRNSSFRRLLFAHRRLVTELIGGAGVLIGTGLAYSQFSRRQFALDAWALGIGIGAAGLWGALRLWWLLPKWQVARLSLRIRDPKARADTEDNFRKTIGQLIGGAAVLVGAGLAYMQFLQQQQATKDLLISNQVAKGFEQLGSDKVAVRLGGIYALEGAMNTSVQYHQPILEALCAFVRESTIGVIVNEKPTTDIQATLTVIGRRADGTGDVNLAGARIPKANLFQANLEGANLNKADFSHAHLSHANLLGAYLIGATLKGANLSGANLGAAHLSGADLKGATLNADLTFAKLSGADLSGATLIAGDIADNSNNMTSIDLLATIIGVASEDQSYQNAKVDQSQLDEACGTDVKLPSGLTIKPCNQSDGTGLSPPAGGRTLNPYRQ